MAHQTIGKIEDDSIWNAVCALEGCVFQTARGMDYSFLVRRSRTGEINGEIQFDRKAKTITRATLVLAYRNAVAVQEREGCVSGPKKLGVFGASYLYPIFLYLGVCTRTQETESKSTKEETTMARPKGSKNKKKLAASDGISLEEMIAQRSEAVAALEAERDEVAVAVAEQNARLKEIKSQLKKLGKELDALNEQKAAEEAAAAAAAAKEAVQNRIDALLAEGKSLEDIMNMLG